MKFFKKLPIVPEPEASFTRFVSQLPEQAGVIELGCNDGVTALQALRLRQDLRWIGIDESPDTIKTAQELSSQYRQAGFQSPVFACGDPSQAGQLEATRDAPFNAAVVRLPANLFKNIVGVIALVVQVSDLLLPDGLAYLLLPGVFESDQAVQDFLSQVFDSAVFGVVKYFPGIAYILRKY